MLRAFAQRHEPTAIAGAVPFAAAHSASQVGTSFVLAQHFSARCHELTATAEDLVVFALGIRSPLALPSVAKFSITMLHCLSSITNPLKAGCSAEDSFVMFCD